MATASLKIILFVGVGQRWKRGRGLNRGSDSYFFNMKNKFKKALKKEWEHHIAISCFIVMDGKNFWGPVNGGGVF